MVYIRLYSVIYEYHSTNSYNSVNRLEQTVEQCNIQLSIAPQSLLSAYKHVHFHRTYSEGLPMETLS